MLTLFSSLTTIAMVLLLLLLVGTIDGGAISASSCLSSEASILLRIKEDLRLLNGRLSSWVTNGSNDCCMWEGVACDPRTGHVIGLQLHGGTIAMGFLNFADISGSRIPPSLFELHQLQHLDLSGCDFDGSAIPPELAQLTRLTHLNLSHSWLSGRVPHEISSMSNLVSLDISHIIPIFVLFPFQMPYTIVGSYLTLEDLEGFVQNLKHLEYLHLSRVSIGLRNPQEWSISLSSALPNLRSLNLASCDFEGSLSYHLFKLPHLQALDLSYNDGLNGELMPSFFPPESNLQSLRLASTNLSGRLPSEIFELPLLKVLDMANNGYLSGRLPISIGNHRSLTHLDLSAMGLLGSLPATIGNLTALTHLDLSKTNLSGSLPPTIGNITTLTHLDLSHTHLSGSLPASIGSLHALSYLNLTSCMLTNIFDSSCFVNLNQLTHLDLSENMISGSLPSLPQYLSTIRLQSNNFSGPIPNSCIPFKIMILDLSDNSLIGTIPFSLIHGPSSVQSPLQYVDLSNNKFDGYLDLGIFSNFKNLSFLSLSGNNFTVDVHNPTLEFPSLRELRLVSCNINQFPLFLRHYKPIDTLDLSNNMITGEIPKWLNISYSLNISHNMLTNFEQGVFLKSLIVDLSFNNMTGEIPAFLCNCTSVSLLDLSNNKLTGQIPECLFNLTMFKGVKLQNNQLQGQIPEFNNYRSLTILDLSDNMLEGNIPTSLQYSDELELINLGHNRLSGGFPSWLAKLPNLRILVLRSNSLSGAINFTINQNAFQNLVLLDISTNQFTGELPPGFLLGLNAMKIFNSTSTIPGTSASYHIEWKVTVNTKGTNLTYEWKASIMKMIDLSNNCFEGEISKEIGDLSGLQALKFSHNKLKGPIPKSIGALEHLESLDLSHNYLSGVIPEELTALNFLGYLNLSHNNLSGRIPQSPHFSTFDVPSFEGNPSLCGPPLSLPCEANSSTIFIPFIGLSGEDDEKMWKYISIGLGFGAGFGTAISFSYFLNNGWMFNSFWRRCYWSYAQSS